MASCAALNCTFLDQYESYLRLPASESQSTFAFPPAPQPPSVVADSDIAGLGVNSNLSSQLVIFT